MGKEADILAKIVVVEDDVYMREELLNLLEKSGYDTIGLSDFENAVSEIAAYFPDLILLDINLPFRSGFEICKELKAKQIGTVLVWAHEIKKPLSLMTLLLDNRKNEMSPLVHTRMLYVRDHARQDVEQILYFSRLGAVHKDYYFEPLSILRTCREAVEDNVTLLEEAGFSIEFLGNEYQIISDKKGLMFILGQIISNSVKYAEKKSSPFLQFSINEASQSEEIILSINDNGMSIPISDLPFVFDKGFTGDTGSYLSRSTGMGLYLVQKMANDLTIKVEIQTNSYGGTTVTLTFPKVERPFFREV